MTERTSEEIAEIERHKYFLSQNRGYDVGWESAERDWDEHHGPVWRREREQSLCSGQPDAQSSCCDGSSVATDTREQDADVRRLDRAAPQNTAGARSPYLSRWQQFFSRFFARSG